MVILPKFWKARILLRLTKPCGSTGSYRNQIRIADDRIPQVQNEADVVLELLSKKYADQANVEQQSTSLWSTHRAWVIVHFMRCSLFITVCLAYEMSSVGMIAVHQTQPSAIAASEYLRVSWLSINAYS